MKVGRVSSATRHCQPGSGHVGSPSSITIDDRTSERRDERVPHHPGGRAEPEQAAARLQVPAQRVRLEALEQDAAVPVDDGLRRPVGPGREQHEQRVVEGDRLERERPGLGEQLVPGERVRNRVLAVGDVDDVAQGREGRRGSSPPRRGGRPSGRGSRTRRPSAAPRARAARGGRRRCARRARARSSPRPLRDSPSPRTPPASRGCSAGRRRRGRPGRRRAARGRLARAPPARGGPRTRARPARASGSARRSRPAPASSSWPIRCSAKFSRAPGNHDRAGHRVGGEDGAVRGVRLHLEELPDRRPEAGEVVDRPAPQLVVVREREPALALEPGEVAPDLGRLPHVRRRRPQDRQGVPTCAPC